MTRVSIPHMAIRSRDTHLCIIPAHCQDDEVMNSAQECGTVKLKTEAEAMAGVPHTACLDLGYRCST